MNGTRPQAPLRLVYFALITSTVFYAGIVWFLSRSWTPARTVEQELHQPIILILMVLSMATFALSFSLADWLMSADTPARRRGRFVLRVGDHRVGDHLRPRGRVHRARLAPLRHWLGPLADRLHLRAAAGAGRVAYCRCAIAPSAFACARWASITGSVAAAKALRSGSIPVAASARNSSAACW